MNRFKSVLEIPPIGFRSALEQLTLVSLCLENKSFEVGLGSWLTRIWSSNPSDSHRRWHYPAPRVHLLYLVPTARAEQRDIQRPSSDEPTFYGQLHGTFHMDWRVLTDLDILQSQILGI